MAQESDHKDTGISIRGPAGRKSDNHDPAHSPYLTMKQAIRFTGETVKNIRAAILSTQVRAHKEKGRWRVDKQTLQAWSQGRKNIVPDPCEPTITITEAAREAGASPQTIREAIQAGKLEAIATNHERVKYRITQSQFRRYLSVRNSKKLSLKLLSYRLELDLEVLTKAAEAGQLRATDSGGSGYISTRADVELWARENNIQRLPMWSAEPIKWDESKEFLTLKDVVVRYNVSERNVRQDIQDGYLPAKRENYYRYSAHRIDPKDAEKWYQERWSQSSG